MNFISARLVKENGGHEVVFGNTRLALTQEELGRAKERGYDPGKKVKGRKRQLLVDTEGLVMTAKFTRPTSSTATG